MGGSHRITVTTGAELPETDWAWEQTELPEASPYNGPAWWRATEHALPGVRAWHTVATRGRGEIAWLPGFAVDGPAGADLDPRTYLPGFSAEEVFPALVLGSPLGFRTEVAFTFWNRALPGRLFTSAVESATANGFRTVLAPWIPDRLGNEHLGQAVLALGGARGFWGYEDYLRLDAPDYDSHVASLSKKHRQRARADSAAAANLYPERLTGDALSPHLRRIAELTAASQAKNGEDASAFRTETMLRDLLDAGADLRCHLAHRDGDIVACCVTVRKADRLYAKWFGLDYAALGERSGVYFAIALEAPLREAYAEHARFLELGAGAHEAKSLRGFVSRSVTTGVVMTDPAARDRAAVALAESSGRRRRAFSPAAPALSPAVADVSSRGAGCCGNG